jgi:hypothetical protein
MTSYTTRHRNYYINHKDEIKQKEQEGKRWRSYYENNKEAVKARNLARYHQRKNTNLEVPNISQFMPITSVDETPLLE